MEFDEIIVKESPGLCRCCLSEGCYKDMGTEYAWMNENEVYADMLLECFDISISQLNDGPNGPNRLICEVCITRLRDACYFKKQVLESEKKFIDMVGRGEFKSKAILVSLANMKAETADDDDAASFGTDDADPEYLDDEIEYLEEDILKAETQEPGVSDVTADPLPVRGKRGRPRKDPVKADKKKVKTEPKPKSSKPVLKEVRHSKKKGIKSPSQSGIEAHKNDTKATALSQDVLQVLTKSTAMPFKWSNSSYRCFYCLAIFQEPNDLRLHQIAHTSDDEKSKVMSNFWESKIYVDVSDLFCILCPLKMESLENLIEHLQKEHEVPFNQDCQEVGACMRPFKLKKDAMQCVQCDKKYKTFVHLLKHGYKRHNNLDITCEICGYHFQTLQLLKEHMNKEHGKQTHQCRLCGDKLISVTTMRSHMKKVHNKKYKCSQCSELFTSHYMRSNHIMRTHDVDGGEKFQCKSCEKCFVFQSMLKNHVRESHLKARDVICSICGWATFNETKLRIHLRTTRLHNSTDSNKRNDHLTVKYEITPIEPILKQKMVAKRKNIVNSTDSNKKNDHLNVRYEIMPIEPIPKQKMVTVRKRIVNSTDSNKKNEDLTITRRLRTREPIPEQKMVAIRNKNIVNASDKNKKKDHLTTKRKLRTKEPIPEQKMVAIRKNIVQVLIHSNVMPFVFLGYGYKCFYCYEIFIETEELKNHQIIHSQDNDIVLEAVGNFSEIAVHVDVTDLSCKLCSAVKNHLYDLIEHLTNDHDIVFNEVVGPCMKPFKLNKQNLECVICSQTFKSFRYILFHMNHQHGGLYRLTCEECGRHFRRQTTFRQHLVIHTKGAPCNLCGEVLKSGHQMRSHMQNVHGKKHKCDACGELFETHYKRSMHMMVVHKNKEEIKCQFCDKTFVFRSNMLVHLRRTHLGVRNSVCHLCGWRTEAECQLKLHMRRHSSERHFKCSSCEQAYKTNKSLKKHIRKAHEN